MTNIGMPEKKVWEIEPLVDPVPGPLPDFEFEPETTEEPVAVPV